ncbi:MAG: aconitate hydratase [Myxococcota bacterium]
MARSVAQKLIDAHLVDGEPTPGHEVGLAIDQTLTQDATGTLVMLALEAMDLDRVRTELSAQYVDHNLLQEDFKNPDDHLFLQSACRRFGVWFSRPGNGVSHPVHMQRFGRPGASMLGSDSHTCAAGALGMLAVGAGGLEVAMAMAGEPFWLKMPEVWGVRLTGELPPWVSAKDVILEMLRRHGVKGGSNRIIEYHGPGVETLDPWDRHVIANMGAELGATTTVFPSDESTRRFLAFEGREEVHQPLQADEGAAYDVTDAIDLSALEPLVAKPSSPGNVVPVRELAGQELYQAYLGSSANPGYRDFAIAALMARGRHVAAGVSFDVNPTSRELLEQLVRAGLLGDLIHAGARLHQAGCNGCIGMGQAPASGRNSLRTVPRNFPGRSGSPEDSVFLCSPETATASALAGVVTDPRDLGMEYPEVAPPPRIEPHHRMLLPPPSPEESRKVDLVKGPNIESMPRTDPVADALQVPILLKVPDDVSTDEIMPAGARVLPYRSNVPKIAQFCFEPVDATYPRRAEEVRDEGGHAIVGGENYGQGSSREHAAIAPRYLGLRVVLAKSFARIHWQNLVNFGILPLTFANPSDYDHLERDDVLMLSDVHEALRGGRPLDVRVEGRETPLRANHDLSSRQLRVLQHGGLIGWKRDHEKGG